MISHSYCSRFLNPNVIHVVLEKQNAKKWNPRCRVQVIWMDAICFCELVRCHTHECNSARVKKPLGKRTHFHLNCAELIMILIFQKSLLIPYPPPHQKKTRKKKVSSFWTKACSSHLAITFSLQRTVFATDSFWRFLRSRKAELYPCLSSIMFQLLQYIAVVNLQHKRESWTSATWTI